MDIPYNMATQASTSIVYILTTQFQSFIRGHVTLIGMGVLAWALSITHNTSPDFL